MRRSRRAWRVCSMDLPGWAVVLLVLVALPASAVGQLAIASDALWHWVRAFYGR